MEPKDLYEQGSEQCRQYSAMTMQVRTMAQHVLIAYAVGIGIVLSRAVEPAAGSIRTMVLVFSAILVLFGMVLWTLNHHYSNAFQRIRDDVLVSLELKMPNNPLANGNASCGPWSAHQCERNEHRIGPILASTVAWNLPFVALILVGLAGITFALFWMK